MEDENNKSTMWVGILGLLFSFTIGIPGVTRSFKNNTSAWDEMGKIIYTGVSWILGAITLYIICCVAAFILKAIWEKTDALFVMYNKSENWCKKLDLGYEKNEEKHSDLEYQIDKLKRSFDDLSEQFDQQQELLKKLQAIPSVLAEVNQQSAEDEFTGSV